MVTSRSDWSNKILCSFQADHYYVMNGKYFALVSGIKKSVPYNQSQLLNLSSINLGCFLCLLMADVFFRDCNETTICHVHCK